MAVCVPLQITAQRNMFEHTGTALQAMCTGPSYAIWYPGTRVYVMPVVDQGEDGCCMRCIHKGWRERGKGRERGREVGGREGERERERERGRKGEKGGETMGGVKQVVEQPKYSIAVFCGSKSGASPNYASAARALGATIARRGFRLVYGGGSVGLMGEVAMAVAETAASISASSSSPETAAMPAAGAGVAAGKCESVIGVIPEALKEKEMSGNGVGIVEVVKDMHERKRRMAEIADCFIAMPGGYGTMEELFEVVTWQQLGLHKKPVGVLNINGYYDSLLAFTAHAHTEGFVSDANKDLILNDSDPELLIEKCLAYEPPEGAIEMVKRLKREKSETENQS